MSCATRPASWWQAAIEGDIVLHPTTRHPAHMVLHPTTDTQHLPTMKVKDVCATLCGLACIVVLYGCARAYQYFLSMNKATLAFAALRGVVEQIPERLVMIDKNGEYSGRMVVDLSWDREFSLVVALLQKRTPKPHDFQDYVVDLGAFDGKISSNSYNFFQIGWDGMVVEANRKSMELAKAHTRQFLDLGQRLTYEQVAVVRDPVKPGEPTKMRLVQYANPTENSLEGMKNHYADEKLGKIMGKESWNYVDKVDILTLFKRNKVPLKFGLLSIDIEDGGSGATGMVCKVIAANYEPEFIIIEADPPTCFTKPDATYEFVAQRRYNQIWRKKRQSNYIP